MSGAPPAASFPMPESTEQQRRLAEKAHINLDHSHHDQFMRVLLGEDPLPLEACPGTVLVQIAHILETHICRSLFRKRLGFRVFEEKRH